MSNSLATTGNQGMTVQAVISSPATQNKFEKVLGKRAPAFLSSIISAISSNYRLSNADPISIVSSAMVAATLDLPINPNLSFAHLVPYGGKAQFQMGWRGFVQLAMRSGQYQTINVAKVHEGDIRSQNAFTGVMEFNPVSNIDNPLIGFVAYFKLLNGFEKYLYMSKAEIEAHGKKYSKMYTSKDGHWQTNFEGMGKKTVLKMLLSKFGVLSVEMQKAMKYDQAVVQEDGEPLYPDNSQGSKGSISLPEKAELTPEQSFETAKAIHVAEFGEGPADELILKLANEEFKIPFSKWKAEQFEVARKKLEAEIDSKNA